MSRLSIEITSEQHKKIKALAAIQGKTIKDLIIDKVINANSKDEQKNWHELQKLLLDRIENAEVSPKTIEEITEDVLKS
jgi:CCR4-NOT transcriptional regulation complex NOT5 subunit